MSTINLDRYSRILVTGADGFIGSHLVELLLDQGANVRALWCYNSFNHWGWLDTSSHRNSGRLDIVSGDVRDPFLYQDLVEGVDIIFNLASLVSIPYSYRAPRSYVETNVLGTVNVCEAAKHAGVKLIQISTSEVYGTAVYVPIDENHPKQAQSPYSAAKIGADAVAMSYYRSFDLPVVIARPFNTYGPRQSTRGVIPTIITQILSGQTEILLGDVTPTRDFNFVTDTCNALIKLAVCDDAVGHEVNIGSGSETSILELVETVKEITSSNIRILKDVQRFRPPKSEVRRLVCDAGKLHRLTGFRPEYDLRAGMKITVNWFRQNLNKYKAGVYDV